MARERRPGREGCVADGTGPTPLPGLGVVVRVRDGVLPPRGGGDDRRGAIARCGVDPVTWRVKDKPDG